MKPKQFVKKLSLNKKTITNLTRRNMDVIKGEGTTPLTACIQNTCPATCPYGQSCPGKDCPIPVIDPGEETNYNC